jgi:hypothetical protein
MKTSWSFSSLMNYERCPHTQSFPYVKAQGGQASCEAAQRGFDIHAQCAKFEYTAPGFDFETLKLSHPIVEQKYGLDAEWNECGYYEAWLKIIPDVLQVDTERITIIDYKTGKREYKEIKHSQQMQLYACALDALYPGRLEINTQLWYLDQGFIHSSSLSPKRIGGMRMRLHNRALTMLSDEKMTPKPSKSNCRFCNDRDRCDYAFEE